MCCGQKRSALRNSPTKTTPRSIQVNVGAEIKPPALRRNDQRAVLRREARARQSVTRSPIRSPLPISATGASREYEFGVRSAASTTSSRE